MYQVDSDDLNGFFSQNDISSEVVGRMRNVKEGIFYCLPQVIYTWNQKSMFSTSSANCANCIR